MIKAIGVFRFLRKVDGAQLLTALLILVAGFSYFTRNRTVNRHNNARS
jgi:hypothetical protein